MRNRLAGIWAIAAGLPAALAAQDVSDSAAFLRRLGTDTTHIERFTRAGNRLEGVSIARAPQTSVWRWTAELAEDGSVRRWEATRRAGVTIRRVVVTFAGDSMRTETADGTTREVATVAAPPGAVPSAPFWTPALDELALRRAAGADSVTVAALAPGNDRVFSTTFKRAGGDTMMIFQGSAPPLAAAVDRDGRLLWIDYPDAMVERAAAPDSAALAAFAARPLGVLSPRGSAEAEIAGVRLAVQYGRPARRGRTVWGKVVPWNEVWRSGANEATQFQTSGDLVMGGADIPAGAYTLFTLPSPDGWKLVVNKKTKDASGEPLFGTDYDASEDLVRLDLKVDSLPQVIERFTIGIRPRGEGGVLWLAWDTTRASIEFAPKPAASP